MLHGLRSNLDPKIKGFDPSEIKELDSILKWDILICRNMTQRLCAEISQEIIMKDMILILLTKMVAAIRKQL